MHKEYWRGSNVYILCNWVSLHFPKLANGLLYGQLSQIFTRWMAFVFRKIGWMLTGRRDNNCKMTDLSSKKNIVPFLKNWTKKRNLNWLPFSVSSFRIFNRLEFRDLSEGWVQGSVYMCDTFFSLPLKDSIKKSFIGPRTCIPRRYRLLESPGEQVSKTTYIGT